jgi:histidinol-phosphate aminotransferase
MSVLPSSKVQQMNGYQVRTSKPHSASDEVITADWNESAISPSPIVIRALSTAIQNGKLNRYPDTTATELKNRISQYVGFQSSHIEVFAGLDHAFEVICQTYLDDQSNLVICAPTYDNFRAIASAFTSDIRIVLGESAFSPKPDAIKNAIDLNTKLVYIVNPDNPTGRLYTKKEIERLLGSFPRTLFILDEAYYEFWGETFVDLVKVCDNLLISRSFSKAFGLAGLRIGYVVTNSRNVENLGKVRNGKHVTTLSQVAAIAALDDVPYMKNYVAEVRLSMQYLEEQLTNLGFKIFTTPANYLLISSKDPKELFQRLAEKGIFLRDRSSMPQLAKFIRLTVGTRAEADKFLTIMKDLVYLC